MLRGTFVATHPGALEITFHCQADVASAYVDWDAYVTVLPAGGSPA